MTDPIDPAPTLDAAPTDRDTLADSFDALQTALEPAIRRFIRRMLGQYNDALAVDDLTQETFVALYRRLRGGDGALDRESVQPYAYGIARHLVYAELRRIRRYGLGLADDHDQIGGDTETLGGYAVVADPSEAPEDAAHWLMLTMQVRAAIDRLPEAQRLVLILYSEEGMGYEEIARITGVNVGTVASRLHYAKRTLRGLLSAETLAAVTSSL
jgi:RNA polymerase sigma factor (sigma-70 family)